MVYCYDDGQVVGVKGGDGGPARIDGKMRAAEGEVRGGWLAGFGDAGGLVGVEEGEVAIVYEVGESRASPRTVLDWGEPGGAVGVEVPHYEGGGGMVQEEGEVGSKTGRAGGGRGDVYIDDIDGSLSPGDRDPEVLGDTVTREEMVSWEWGVLDGVVDEDKQTPTTSTPRAIAAN